MLKNKTCKNVISVVLFLIAPFFVGAQGSNAKKFQTIVNNAVQKVKPACVRIWGYDVEQKQRTTGQFSGVVVSSNGYILTAAHTVLPGKNYKVFFPDGKECIAVALGRIDNKETPGIPDVGMMKIIDNGIWPFAEMGFSYSLVENEPCISISYPETLDQKLPTLRLGRIAEVKNTYGFIRSTCKMEPGDSGGPLFDYMGRVIGLHSAIDVSEDQNFEIPIDLYRKYWTALKLEKSYNSFPKTIDSIGLDPFRKQIEKDVKSKDLNPKLNSINPNNRTCYQITSYVDGKVNIIAGTLLNFKTDEGIYRQFFVSKNTAVGADPFVLINGNPVNLTILGQDKENDLILLGLPKTITGGIDLSAISHRDSKIDMGTLLYTVKPDGKIIHSVLSSGIFSLPKNINQPFLGAMVAYNVNPAQFSLIKPGSPADLAGIKIGDQLSRINGEIITKADEFGPQMMKLWPDDTVEFEWLHETQKIVKKIKLSSREKALSNHPAAKFEGGKSDRRDGFSEIFAQDAAIKPSECGTPVFDWQGNFYGINIARFSRTATICVRADVIKKMLENLL